MPQEKAILVVANSARMLAQLANNIGCQPIVVDCFCDQDTQLLALDCQLVSSLALDQLKPAFLALHKQYAISHFIYGSGLERYTDSLEFLQQHLTVWGNSWECFKRVQNKTDFFFRLNQLQISHPEVSFQPTTIDDGWLIKPMQGEGGFGIKTCQTMLELPDSCYWQRFQEGQPMSVLFVANGKDYKIIGFNKQLFSKIDQNEFVFSGVISLSAITERINKTLNHWLYLLVCEYNLTGINSLDFIANDNDCFLLEINARPSASIQLYHDDLLSEHINGCCGSLNSKRKISSQVKAYQVVFADTDIYINEEINWPSWVVDIPNIGVLINTGMPICSIIACGNNDQQVEENLLYRRTLITNILNR